MSIRCKYILSLCCALVVILLCNDAYAAKAGVFHDIAQRTGGFAEGLRKLAYVISGFGMVMFTFLAICGKINFKHLGYITISLFFLSGMGALITYAKGGNQELVYNFKDTYQETIKPKAGDMKVPKSSKGNSSFGR